MNLIILGRSPFLHTVKIDSLKYDKACINYPPCSDVKWAFSYDKLTDIKIPEGCEYITPENGYIFDKHGANFDRNEPQKLGFCIFTVSAAVNWAYLNAFKNVYLVGIDHFEKDTRYLRNDGTKTQNIIPAENHRKIKEFIYQFKDKMNIYQTNPETSWDLEYININELYEKKA